MKKLGQLGQTGSAQFSGLTSDLISGYETGSCFSEGESGKKTCAEQGRSKKSKISVEHKKIIIEYTEWLNAKGYKPRGIEELERSAKKFFEYIKTAGIDYTVITIREAESFRENLRLKTTADGHFYNTSTVNNTITHLRILYKYLTSTGKVMRNPFFDVERMKEAQSLPKNILSIEEMKTFLDSIEVKDRDDFKFKVIIELLYATGARISELENLTLENINLNEGYITIQDNKEKRERICPLTEYSSRLLNLYLRENKTGQIFAHGAKRTLNRWVNDRLKRITIELELPLITCHSIRHTIATHLLKKGADIREVQEFLGHSRIKNTEVYTRIFPDDLRDLLERTHPREMSTEEAVDETGSAETDV